MRYIFTAVTIIFALLAIGCSQQESKHVATVYQEPEAVKMADDSLEAFAAAKGTEAKFEGFRAVYEHFLEQYPNSTDLHRDFQSLFRGFQQSDKALAYYQKLYDENPNSAMHTYLLGRIVPDSESRSYFEKAIELDPDYFWGHFGLASAMLNDTPSDTAGAIEQYWKAAEIDNSYPITYRQAASLFIGQNKYEEALEAIDLYQTTQPDELRPVAMKSETLIKMGRKVEAEHALLDFLAEHADNDRAKDQLVKMYLADGRYQQALPYQHQLAETARDPSEAVFTLARTYALLNLPDTSLDYLDKAVALGFADKRRLEKHPDLAPVRNHPAYPELLATVIKESERIRETRLSVRKEGADERKANALADKLSVPAPDFSLVNLEGETYSLTNLRGKVVVLDFWATWCGPCRLTMPLLQEFADNKQPGVEVFSVNVWESDTSKVRPFLSEYGYELNVLFGSTALAGAYNVSGIPTLVVIDKEGVIRYRHIGYSPDADEQLIWQAQSLL